MTEGQPDRPRPARVAAIDPSSVKAGMVVLQIEPAEPGFIVPDPDHVSVLARHTVRTSRKDDFAARMSRLLDQTELWSEGVRRNWKPELWCIEDPRAAWQKRHTSGVTLGAAFGVACAAFSVCANRCGVDVTLVPAQEWIPKTRGGRNNNFIIPMKHDASRSWLRARWPALASLTDDETFAAGVAIWAHTKGAMAAVYPI